MGTIDEVAREAGGCEERILVSVRLRPLNNKEIFRNDVSDWECINDTTIIYKNVNLSVSERSMYPSAYSFDRVFRPNCSTRQVYEEAAKDVALSVVSGFNSSVFAYGQTSSGKTFTMTGITEYAIADIYDYIQKHAERDFILKFSAMEIYNESVRDLLSADSTPLRLLDDPERGTIVEKLTEETLRDWNHVIQLLSICEAQRQIGETALNETSSRSHQIIRLTIESSAREYLGRDNSSTLSATVNFVDLAGSERASQSLSAGARLKEGCHINRSLLTLGTVIRKLSKSRNGHIPFRDSKLTRILQPSLGGNGRTAIICTMSPARSHVEQSRNTLLFASCAKEVTTTAQVNVVMSDKVLVKHLQRELARLESELRSPIPSLFPSDYEALLREKNKQIEQMEKEIKDLTLQRDIAQTQVKEMQQMLGDDASLLMQVGFGNYPNLRVRRSPDYRSRMQVSILSDTPSIDADVRTCSDGHSRSSSEDQIIRVPEFEENFLHKSSSPRLLAGSSNYSESDSCEGWDEIEKQSNGTSEDLFKEVHCIETEESSVKGKQESNFPSPEESSRFPAEMTAEYGDRANKETISPPADDHRRSVPPSLKEDGELTLLPCKEEHGFVALPSFEEERKSNEDALSLPSKDLQTLESAKFSDSRKSVPLPLKEEKAEKEEKELVCTFDVPSPANLSSPCELIGESPCSRNLKLCRSRSCKASLMADVSSYFEELATAEITPPSVSERNFSARPKGWEIKISPLNFTSDVGDYPEKDSTVYGEVAINIGLEVSKGEDTTYENVMDVDDTCDSGSSEKDELQPEKEVRECPVHEAEPEHHKLSKCVRDVGLDPIEDELKSLSSWTSEFKILQKEIMELWHVCNISLVHRTYFFLLFQGDDPKDAVYMEVEIRRLTFLNDIYTRGEKTVVNGRTLSLAQSMKDLRQERRMLRRQMLRKLTEEDRESLYLKWGIRINSKLRRLQLAQRLWKKTDDMNHIADSAYLIAKLTGLMKPGQAPKEMFGLDFSPRPSKTYSFTRSLISSLS
ncbi:kinesin-like protein KIN-7E [Nicotiana sylvestris]|uniref:Kinesin-like protein NACK2 n=1 Tax=Nicotiana sylvestris TaxID=4096 RepID=A0A1U7WCF5_NICSY|nr:PREDICTED: kinesin-like protein NACK2 [Nicotiana sylvestris]